MIKAVLFVDGGWLSAHISELGQAHGRADLQIDLKRLPRVLVDEIARQNRLQAIDLIRTHYFSSYAEDCDPRDQAAVERRKAFLATLATGPGIDVESFPVDYRGRRLRRQDRPADDDFVPRTKAVDVALSVLLMRYAMTPGALDLALLLIGSADFVPLLQEVRRLGKRVAVISIAGACAPELADPGDAAGVRDFDVLWLDGLVDRIERAPGGRADLRDTLDVPPGQSLRGRVKNIIRERGYGFIAADDGRDYFFHANALEGGLVFEELQTSLEVTFEIKSGPLRGRAGAARSVRPAAGAPIEAGESDAPPPAAEDSDMPPPVDVSDTPPAAEASHTPPPAARSDIPPAAGEEPEAPPPAGAQADGPADAAGETDEPPPSITGDEPRRATGDPAGPGAHQ